MDRYLKTRIETISERDFWGSMKPAAGLRDAIAAGLAGRREKAYHLLGEYHAQTLAGEAEAFVQSVRSGSRAADAAKRKKDADQVLRHDIVGWHTLRRQFGPRIDFNADFGRSGQYGFHYLGWLLPVINQYAATDDTKYRDGFLDIIGQYYEQRTGLTHRIPHLHPVYYELGAHAKARLLLPAYALLARDPAVGAGAREGMLKLLMGFGRSLFRLQESGYRAGNWQIVGCASLYHLGAAFPEWREAAGWRKRANALLVEHARRDFFADGGHGERCWGYGFMSLGGIIEFYESAQRHGLLAARERGFWSRFLRRGLTWFAHTTSPTGHHLNYGDGGISSAQGVFDTAARLFPDLARGPGLLGVDRSRSEILRPSGYAFMRGGSDPEAPFLSVNFGRYGGGHTHRDLLDFSLWSFGRPLIEEVGRWGSYDNPLDSLFRSEQAHNQIVIEHARMEREKHEAHDVRWHSSEDADAFSAWHEAYPGIRIRRQIVFLKPAGWFLVFDTISAKEYIFQASSYLHAPAPFLPAGAGRWRTAGSPACLVAVAEPSELRRTATGVDYGRADTGTGVAKHSYEFSAERHRLVLSRWRDVGDPRPITFAMLLVPFKGRAAPRAELRPLALSGRPAAGAAAFEARVGARRDLVVFNGNGGRAQCAGHATAAPVSVRIGRRWVDLSWSQARLWP